MGAGIKFYLRGVMTVFFNERSNGRLRVFFLIAAFLTILAIGEIPILSRQARAADSKAELKAVPVNPAYVEYWKKAEAGERTNGLMPSPINWNAMKMKRKAKPGRAAIGPADLPVSFDLVREKVTPPVANQKSWGTCWAFGTIAAIESSIMSADKTNSTNNYKNLSEFHLAYYRYYDEGPDKPAFDAEDVAPDENPIFSVGGTAEAVIALLSRGTGPLAWEDAPYPDLEESKWSSYVPDKAPPTGPVQFHLRNSYYFWDDKPEEIKVALMKHGGLSFSIGYYDDAVSGDSIYTPNEESSSNHQVMLVGWDDTYPKTAFKTQPENDGAWKIQNSWGEKAGTDGFYWISYEDKMVFGGENEDLREMAFPCAFEMGPADAYDAIYFRDPLGMSGTIEIEKDSDFSAANVFTARRDEKIVTVGFNTVDDDMDYEIRVYRNIRDGEAPGAEPAVVTVPHYVQDGGGYVTLDLEKPVPIRKGERFAVAVTFKSEDGIIRNIPIEAKIKGYASKATIGKAESYYKFADDENWEDIFYDDTDKRGNFCVKAMTLPYDYADNGGGGGGGGCDAGAASLLALLPIGAVFVIARARKNYEI
jgi:C1A family cysteine protease